MKEMSACLLAYFKCEKTERFVKLVCTEFGSKKGPIE
jgi:hypothetical protein